MEMTQMKFYTVTMPDDQEYAATGNSIRDVAAKNKVDVKNVRLGVDLFNTPDVSEYPLKENDPRLFRAA